MDGQVKNIDTDKMKDIADEIKELEVPIENAADKNISIPEIQGIDLSLIDDVKEKLKEAREEINILSENIMSAAEAFDSAENYDYGSFLNSYNMTGALSDINNLTYYSNAWGTGESGKIGENVSSDGDYTINRFEFLDKDGNHLGYIGTNSSKEEAKKEYEELVKKYGEDNVKVIAHIATKSGNTEADLGWVTGDDAKKLMGKSSNTKTTYSVGDVVYYGSTKFKVTQLNDDGTYNLQEVAPKYGKPSTQTKISQDKLTQQYKTGDIVYSGKSPMKIVKVNNDGTYEAIASDKDGKVSSGAVPVQIKQNEISENSNEKIYSKYGVGDSVYYGSTKYKITKINANGTYDLQEEKPNSGSKPAIHKKISGNELSLKLKETKETNKMPSKYGKGDSVYYGSTKYKITKINDDGTYNLQEETPNSGSKPTTHTNISEKEVSKYKKGDVVSYGTTKYTVTKVNENGSYNLQEKIPSSESEPAIHTNISEGKIKKYQEGDSVYYGSTKYTVTKVNENGTYNLQEEAPKYGEPSTQTNINEKELTEK